MRQTGTVKFYNSQKGYGFITPDDGGKDVFVHVTAVEQSGINQLDEGVRISFETEPDKRGKGPKAVNLQQQAYGNLCMRGTQAVAARQRAANFCSSRSQSIDSNLATAAKSGSQSIRHCRRYSYWGVEP